MKLSLSSLIDDKFVATKRNVLRVIATIFGPIGFLTPITVVFKIFCQIVCVSKLGCDEKLAVDLKNKWFGLVDIANSVSVNVPRYYFGIRDGEPENVTLHCFRCRGAVVKGVEHISTIVLVNI